MKKILTVLAIVLVALITTNCKKAPDLGSGTGDVQFNINSITQNGLKFDFPEDVICNTTLLPDYVMYKMDAGDWKTIPVFFVGNIPYTSTMKLEAGPHTLNEFLVYSDNNTPNNTADDVLLWAAPHGNSDWGVYVSTPLDKNFTVVEDQKFDIKIDVICFQPTYYDHFGFVYFHFDREIIRQQCFFGDFCIKDRAEYVGSHYALQPNWVPTGYGDVPAIFKIEVWRAGIMTGSFTNDVADLNYSEKVCVWYGDYLDQTDVTTFKLFILVRQGMAFNFVLFHTWTFNDVSNIQVDQDNVVNFILGSCYDPIDPPQLILAPYQNLPATATLMLDCDPVAPGSLQTYADAILTNIGAGYVLTNGTYGAYCADHATLISCGVNYPMNVYSSLYPGTIPGGDPTGRWAKINWLYNHLDWFPGYHWYDFQQAVWLYDTPPWNGIGTGGVPNLTTMATNMKNAADANGAGYMPPPGGWAAVIFYGANQTIQTLFIQIDP
jgi:hypothetical protein